MTMIVTPDDEGDVEEEKEKEGEATSHPRVSVLAGGDPPVARKPFRSLDIL